MKYLVTGGAGFIGSHLVEELVNNGSEVIVVDDLTTGSLDNLREFKEKINIITGRCSEVVDEIKEIDGIYHLGIPSSSPMYKKDRFLVSKAIEDFISIIELAMKENCRLVFASTSSIYNGNPIPWKEDMDIKITDFYTEGRYYMERLAKLYNDLYGVESIALRFFSVYGEREEAKKQYANLVSQFIWCMKKGEQPVIYGDGTQTRDFIYVKDTVNACILAMESNIKYDIFNVGTGKNYSLNELIEIINNILGTNIKPKYVPNPIKNYVYHTLADPTKAKEKLGFEAKISLEEGIRRLIG
jgi:UDP-glucose 4-epimerase